MQRLDRGLNHRMEVLDAFRGVAIIVVAAYHLIFLSTLEFSGPGESIPPWIRIWSYGFLGVEFFFMISGFVIFMTLARCATTKEFFVRRFARLYPAYAVSVLLVFALVYILSYPHYERSAYDLAVSPFIDATSLDGTFISGVYWSLVTEVRFYILIAIIYHFFRRHFFMVWCALCLVLYAAGAHSESFAELSCALYLPFFTFGIAFYELMRDGMRPHSAALFAVGILGVGLFWLQPTHDTEPIIVLAILAAFFLLFLLFVQGSLSVMGKGPLLFIGRVSYAFYLVHFEISIALMSRLRALHMPPLAAGIIALLVVLAIASALTFLIEDKAKHIILNFYFRRQRSGEMPTEARPPGQEVPSSV